VICANFTAVKTIRRELFNSAGWYGALKLSAHPLSTPFFGANNTIYLVDLYK